MEGRAERGLEESCDILGKNSSMGKWGKGSIPVPGKRTEKTNVLGRSDFNSSSELIADDSSRASKGECGVRQRWGQEPGLQDFDASERALPCISNL